MFPSRAIRLWQSAIVVLLCAGCEDMPQPPGAKPPPPPSPPPTQQVQQEPAKVEPQAPQKPNPHLVIENFKKKNPFEVNDKDLQELAELEEGLEELTELKLNGSQVTSEGLVALEKFEQLESLDLSSTKLGNSAMEQLKEVHGAGHLKSLTTLSLVGAPVDDMGLYFLKDMGQLKHLSLSNTQVTDTGLELCVHLPELESLDVSYTGVNGSGFKFLKDCPLKILSAHHCALQDRYLVSLKGLPIESLALGQSNLTDRSMTFLKGLKELKSIDIGFNLISDAGIANFKFCLNLETLQAQQCQGISDRGLGHLRTLKNLKAINVAGNRCSVVGAEQLKKLIPGLVVAI